MKQKIIVATGNTGKMREFRMILADLGLEIISMKDAGVNADIVEDGTTFAQNAEIKARAVWEQTGDIVLADDSGLVVDYLGGEPGIYSARYLGEDTSYEVKNQVIIDRLAGAKEEERTARFVCAIAAVLPDGQVLHTEGAVEGMIAHRLRQRIVLGRHIVERAVGLHMERLLGGALRPDGVEPAGSGR